MTSYNQTMSWAEWHKPPLHFFLQQQKAFTSSTCRLKRLLAESQQMVASLELSSGQPLSHSQSPPSHSSSPGLSPTVSHCNSDCNLNDGYNNTESRDQSQSPNNSQDEGQLRRVHLVLFLCISMKNCIHQRVTWN